MKKTIGIILVVVLFCLIFGFAVYFKVLLITLLSFAMTLFIVELVFLISWLLTSDENND